MSRRTTVWEDIGIGLLAGATIVLASAIWVLLASDWQSARTGGDVIEMQWLQEDPHGTQDRS